MNQYNTELAASVSEFLDHEVEKVEVAIIRSKI